MWEDRLRTIRNAQRGKRLTIKSDSDVGVSGEGHYKADRCADGVDVTHRFIDSGKGIIEEFPHQYFEGCPRMASSRNPLPARIEMISISFFTIIA